jgi:type II secretory pathway component PulM
MARQARSRLILSLIILIGLAIIAVVCLRSASAASRRIQTAQTELAQATKMTSEIERLNNAPRIASLEMESPDEISQRITAALKQLKSSATSLQSVDPQPPRRIANSEYQIRATEVELGQVKLNDLARFITALTKGGQGLEVRDIVLSETRNASKTAETWLARLTLTQVIYSPTRR